MYGWDTPGKEVENERYEGGREKERSLPEAQRRDEMSGEGRMGRDGRGKTGDAGLEAHTQQEKKRERSRERERQRRTKISERRREMEHERTFYASYVAHAHASASRDRAHTQFEHTDTKAF